jgi:hypothetical protein
MNTLLKVLMVSFLFAATGCSGVTSTPGPGHQTPTSPPTPAAQATPTPTEPVSTPPPSPPSTAASLITSRCSLLNSHDLASLYPTHTEVMLPTPQVSRVTHVVFSTQNVSANEISCVYYVFHLPGKNTEQVLQVNYWVDTPEKAADAAWAQIWADASSQAAQSISGIGDGAFYENGKLTFKKGDIYMTLEITGTSDTLDTKTNAGVEQQIKLEKQVALDALKHF